MAGISAQPRDLDVVRVGLRNWLEKQWTDQTIIGFGDFRTSPNNGFSSESLMFDVVTVSSAGKRANRSLVARLPPRGEGVFQRYDFALQHDVQRLMRKAGVPVPGQVGHCADDSWIGSPFLVMDYVDGRVPSNQPMYNVTGWLKELSPESQAAGHGNALAALAQVHAVQAPETELRALRRPTGFGLAAEVAWYRDYVSWATDGSPPAEVTALTAWCVDRLPKVPVADSICWGDARLGNVMFGKNMSVAALLDWEMATRCPPELDFGWFSAFRRQIRARTGVSSATELPGFPDRDTAIARYQTLLGRELISIEWFEAFAMLRLAGMALSTKRLVARLGISDHFIFGFAPVEQWVLDIIER